MNAQCLTTTVPARPVETVEVRRARVATAGRLLPRRLPRRRPPRLQARAALATAVPERSPAMARAGRVLAPVALVTARAVLPATVVQAT